MKVLMIKAGETKFHTNDLSADTKGHPSEVIEMTEKEYKSLPATVESAEFFK